MVNGLNTVATGGMRGERNVKTRCVSLLCGIGKPVMFVELQEVVGDADKGPFCGTLINTSEGEAIEASKLLYLSKHGFNDVFSGKS